MSERLLTIADVIGAVAEEFGLDPAAIKGPRSDRAISSPRHVVCVMAQRHSHQSESAIARALGRDPTTVRASRERFEKRCAADASFAQAVERISTRLQTLAWESAERMEHSLKAADIARRVRDRRGDPNIIEIRVVCRRLLQLEKQVAKTQNQENSHG